MKRFLILLLLMACAASAQWTPERKAALQQAYYTHSLSGDSLALKVYMVTDTTWSPVRKSAMGLDYYVGMRQGDSLAQMVIVANPEELGVDEATIKAWIADSIATVSGAEVTEANVKTWISDTVSTNAWCYLTATDIDYTDSADVAGWLFMSKATYDTDENSIVDVAEDVSGVGVAGNSKYYGTDGTGTAGFFDLPSGGGASAIDDLSDVVITSATTDQHLIYNGSNWVNQTVSSGGSAGNADSLGSLPAGDYATEAEVSDSLQANAWGYLVSADLDYTDSADVAGWGYLTDVSAGLSDTADVIRNEFVTADSAKADTSHTHTFRYSHSFTIAGEVKVPSGDTDYINPFFVPVMAGTTVKLVECRYRINSGTSATIKLQKNGSDITGFTSMSATGTAASTDPTDVTLADDDMIALVVTAVSGTPKNMSVSLYFEVTQ